MTAVATRPSIPPARYRDRIRRAAEVTGEHAFDALLVGVGPDLRYLTGYVAVPLERLTMLVLAPGRPPAIVVPLLERSAAEAGVQGEVDIDPWEETDDPYRVVARHLPQPARRIAVSDRLWSSHLLRLQATLDGARFEPASKVLSALRMRKDPEEIELLRIAAHAADRVVGQIAAGRLVGRTEADVAREVRERLVAEGHDEATFAIVASGPNSASPHHEAGERVVEAGEPVVLDIGGTVGGYSSDITRTVWVTGGDPERAPDPDFTRLYSVLHDAQSEASAAARPGVAAERVDAVARGIIDAGGFGAEFIHRTGHGIGLDGHEEPYLVAGSRETLEAGMAFSIEPGIYLEGRYGARIEDIVVAAESGPDVLNLAPRDLLVIDG